VDLHGINIFITLDQLHVKNASSCRLGSAPVQIGSSHVTLILSAPHRPDTLKLGRNCWAALDFGPQNGDVLEKTHPSSHSWVPFHLQKSGPYGHLKWLNCCWVILHVLTSQKLVMFCGALWDAQGFCGAARAQCQQGALVKVETASHVVSDLGCPRNPLE
jgi:hypothetical protein